MTASRTVAGLACALLLCACATTPKPQAETTVRPPQRDELGLIGPETPQILRRVSQTPYAPPEPRTCAEVERQIAELDIMLGPDVDSSAVGDENQLVGWAMGAVRGLVPYRSVLRFLTRASVKERELAVAMLAGSARRGYLKGVRETLPCPVGSAGVEARLGGAP